MVSAYQPMFALVGEALADGMAQGVYKPDDVIRQAILLMTIYLGACSQVDENGQVYLKAKEVSDFVLQALGRAA